MRVRTLTITAALALAATACATPTRPPPTGPGFLGSAAVYDLLQPSEADPNIYILRSTARSYRDYQMVMLDQVQVDSPGGAPLSKHDEAQVLELQRMFREVMEIEVGERYPIVDQPGLKTIRIRTAIVDFDPTDESMLGLGTGASLHVEMVDSVSGDRVVAAVAPTQGSAAPGRAARQRAFATMTYWARLLRDRMDYERR